MSDSAPTYVCTYTRAAHTIVQGREVRARARWNSKFERRIDTWRGCVTVAKGTTWLRPNGTARALSHPHSFHPHPSLSNPVTSTFHSTLSLRNISLPPCRFHLSLSLSLFRATFFPVAARQSRTLDVA